MYLCDVGKFLERLRINLDINNQDLSKRLGVSKPYLYYLKKGERTISKTVENRSRKVLKMNSEQVAEWNRLVFVHNINVRNKISLEDFDTPEAELLKDLVIKIKFGDNSIKEELNEMLKG